jgi:hypothetical protein
MGLEIDIVLSDCGASVRRPAKKLSRAATCALCPSIQAAPQSPIVPRHKAAKQRRLVTVGGAVTHPATGSEPDVITWNPVNGTARRVPGRDSVREATSGRNIGCFSGRCLDVNFRVDITPQDLAFSQPVSSPARITDRTLRGKLDRSTRFERPLVQNTVAYARKRGFLLHNHQKIHT